MIVPSERAVAFVFPGQGSQRLGMLAAAPRDADAERLIDAAEALTGVDLRALDAGGDDGALADTRIAQPLLYLTGWFWARALIDRGMQPSFVAGHSLGEFPALAVAGVFSVEAGLELVCERGRLMAEAAARVPGTMAAVLGLDADVVSAAVEAMSGVWVANDNSPGQVVITGTHEGVEAATRALSEAGARRVVPLQVAGPFHCPLMEPARDAFAGFLGAAELADAAVPVLQNTAAAPATDAAIITERLMSQITSQVRWTETMQALVALGVTRVVETGTGSVLHGLARRFEGIESVAVETVGLDGVMEVIAT